MLRTVTAIETITLPLVHTTPFTYSRASRRFVIRGGKMIHMLIIVAATIAFFTVERLFLAATCQFLSLVSSRH
jgi:hypothetical protein